MCDLHGPLFVLGETHFLSKRYQIPIQVCMLILIIYFRIQNVCVFVLKDLERLWTTMGLGWYIQEQRNKFAGVDFDDIENQLGMSTLQYYEG